LSFLLAEPLLMIAPMETHVGERSSDIVCAMQRRTKPWFIDVDPCCLAFAQSAQNLAIIASFRAGPGLPLDASGNWGGTCLKGSQESIRPGIESWVVFSCRHSFIFVSRAEIESMSAV